MTVMVASVVGSTVTLHARHHLSQALQSTVFFSQRCQKHLTLEQTRNISLSKPFPARHTPYIYETGLLRRLALQILHMLL